MSTPLWRRIAQAMETWVGSAASSRHLQLSRTDAPLLASSCRRSTTSSLITGLPSGRHHDKTGAWEMHTDISDRGIAASDDDLMDTRGDQLADDRITSRIIRRDSYCLTRLPTARISRIADYAGDGRSVPRRIERFFRGHWAPSAVADCGNALSPTQQHRKAVERHRRWPEISFQEPNRMVGGEIGKANGRALQEGPLVDQNLIQPIEMRSQLIEQVRHRCHHCGRIDISAGE